MERLAGRKVFTVGKRTYLGQDVLLAAYLWRERAALERLAREGIACLKRAAARKQDVPEALIDDAGEAWRYERDLLAADDLQDWLDGRGLEYDEWLDYVHRALLRGMWQDDLPAIVKAHKVSQKEIDAVLYADAACSGALADLSYRLAGEAAVHERVASQSKGRIPGCTKAELRGLLQRLPTALKRDTRAEHIACVTSSFERFIDDAAAPAAVAREIESHPLEWTRLECEIATFDAESAAREAALLVKEDGLPLTKAAAVARSPVNETHYVLEDVKPPLKDRLVGAQPGEIVGPVAHDDAYVLISVLDRVEPSSKDRSIRQRARERLVRRTIQREIDRRVRWHEPF